mgnify:FL=1
MRIMKKIVSVMLVLGLIFIGLNVTSEAFGGPRMMGGPRYNNQRTNGGQRQFYQNNQYANNPLNLSEEQYDKLVEIRNNYFDNRIEISEELQQVNIQIREFIFENGNNENISNLRTKMINLQNELNNLKINHWEDLKIILTAEQIEEIKEFENRNNNSEEYGYNYHPGMMGFGGFMRMMPRRFGYRNNGFGNRNRAGRNTGPGQRWCY